MENKQEAAQQDINPETPIADSEETKQELGMEEEPPETTEEPPETTEEPPETTEEPPETTEEAPPTEGEEQKGSLLDAVSGLLEGSFDNEQEALEAVREYIGEAKEFKEKTQKKDERLLDLINDFPDFHDLMYLMGQGATYDEAHRVVTGEDDIDIDKAKEGWKKAAADRKKGRDDQKKRLEEINNNVKQTFSTIDKFTKDKGMSKEQGEEMVKKVDEIMINVAQGKLTPAILEVFYGGLNYETATDAAEVRGRNEAIKDIKTKKEAKKGDGLPHPESAATDPQTTVDENDPTVRFSRSIESWAGNRPFDHRPEQ